ncbi:MAG TPA: hypothetical protein VFQ62_23255 [Methylomirabilota bacterium]|nr:hypothetical protein [Methylomirabilota bacterium]
MTRTVVAIVLGVMALLPRTAAACATCISSGFGDRAYTWPYIGLIVMPFVIAVGIVGTLAWYAGWRPREILVRIAAWSARRELSPRTHTETP